MMRRSAVAWAQFRPATFEHRIIRVMRKQLLLKVLSGAADANLID